LLAPGIFSPMSGVGGALAAFDFDSDGDLDLLAGAPQLSVRENTGLHARPMVYCTAKVNSLGCTPAIGSSGFASAAAISGFVVRANQVRNSKVGLLLYGVRGRAVTPFSGGHLCLLSPVRRTSGLMSGGSTSGSDCTGVYSIDMSAFAAGVLGGSPLPALRVVGTAVDGEFWGRDPGFPAPNNTSLSDALEYLVEP
ncbi:MAG TPA: hypothetical protein VM509_06125, partial [Planctomycetota bacterium]|nr:hypothetical protein [Planctomycetota bacterium]